nr:basic proline-rich protein-like [Ovis aries]XP_042096784.1 basic proline-rich protein-like [Ovis aries]XP_042096785.1 basic proline-rich protein-like [Ovis aries]
MVSKPKSSAPPAEPERARRRSSHDSSCSRGPKDPTRGPEHLSSPPPLPATGEHATLGGPSCSVWGPRLLGARDCPWGLCGPALDDLHGPAQPGALWPSGKPPPPAQVAGPWAVSSPAGTALGQPGQGAILPPAQPEAHIPRWPGSPYGEGAAPPLEPQPQPRSLPSPTSLLDELLAAAGAPASPGPSPGAAADHGVDPALPGAPSLLDGLLVAAGAPASPGPSPGAAADHGVDPALPGAPSLLDELLAAAGAPASPGPSPGPSAVAVQQAALAGTPSLLEQISAATGIHATPGPSLGPCAGERAHLALPGSPSVQVALLAAPGIPGSPGPFPGSSPVVAGAHPAFPGSPSLLEEILAATATRDTPWSPRGPLRGTRGLRPPWKHPSVRRITRPSSTCCQAPQALGPRGRGREGPPSPPAHIQVSMPGMLGEAGVGGWVWCVGRGENPAGMSTNNSGDKPPPPRAGPHPQTGGHPYLKPQVIPAWQ